MAAVLKMAPGEMVWICDGQGTSRLVELDDVGKSAVKGHVVKSVSMDGEPPVTVTLYLSLLKRDAFELACRMAAEAGVSEIVPLKTRRTVKLGVNESRLRTIIREAAELAGRSVLPELRPATSLKAALKDSAGNDANWFFEPVFAVDAWHAPGAHTKSGRRKIGVFVGPEGGWDDAEIAEARAVGKNLRLATLGAPVARAETAAVVAIFLAANGKL